MPSWFENYVLPVLTAVGGGGAVWGFLKLVAASRASTAVARIKEPADLLTAMAAFQDAVTKTAEAMMAGLRDEVASLGHQLAEARRQIGELEEENVECRAENGRLKERVGGLEAAWQRAHVTAPGGGEPGSFTVIEGDSVTVITPSPKGG